MSNFPKGHVRRHACMCAMTTNINHQATPAFSFLAWGKNAKNDRISSSIDLLSFRYRLWKTEQTPSRLTPPGERS